SFYPPLSALVYGLWMMPAVAAALIIRKPGAAVFTEALASTVSALLGSFWGIAAVWQGLAEGFGGELPFLLTGYRRFGLPTAIASGTTAGLVATVWDCVVSYPTLDFTSFQLPYVIIGTLSCTVVGGIGSAYLTKALAGTGVLDRFASGRGRALV
ncbi:MAG: ECF transporter S component, partial [Stackebrandtia sp.]